MMYIFSLKFYEKQDGRINKKIRLKSEELSAHKNTGVYLNAAPNILLSSM